MKTEESTYKNKISDNANIHQLIGEHAQLLTNLKNTSITIGDIGSKLDTETEQGKQYMNPNNHDNLAANDKGK